CVRLDRGVSADGPAEPAVGAQACARAGVAGEVRVEAGEEGCARRRAPQRRRPAGGGRRFESGGSRRIVRVLGGSRQNGFVVWPASSSAASGKDGWSTRRRVWVVCNGAKGVELWPRDTRRRCGRRCMTVASASVRGSR